MGRKYEGCVEHDLIIHGGDDVSDLTSVHGSVEVQARGISFPALRNVRGSLRVYQGDNVFPVLTDVGEFLTVCTDNVEFRALTSVVLGLDVFGEKISLPAVERVYGRISVRNDDVAFPALRFYHGVEGSIACIKGYILWYGDDGMWYAGCRGPFTTEQALSHWDRTDERAVAFTAAIRATLNG